MGFARRTVVKFLLFTCQSNNTTNIQTFLIRQIPNYKHLALPTLFLFIFAKILTLKTKNMSGIAKPLVNFTTSKTPNVVVPVDYVMSAEKINISANPNGPAGTAEFLIEFTIVFPNSDTKVSKIYFTSAALRDAAFVAFEALASTAL